MTRQELIDAFSFEGVNRSNAVVNFTEEDPFDPKAVWLNSQHIYAMPCRRTRRHSCCRFSRRPGYRASPEKMLAGHAA